MQLVTWRCEQGVGDCGYTWDEKRRKPRRSRRTPHRLMRPVAEMRNCEPVQARCTCPECGEGHVDHSAGCKASKCVAEPCRKHRSAERARRAWDQLQLAGGDVVWGVLVLTCPQVVRDALKAERRVDGLRLAAWGVFEAWARQWVWNGRSGRLGALLVVHPTGDDVAKESSQAWEGQTSWDTKKDERWAPHVNIIFPMTRWSGTWRRRRRGVVVECALDDLRRRWAEALSEWGWNEADSGVQVHYSFKKDHSPERQAHALRYFLRTFPNWDRRVTWVTYRGYMAPSQVHLVIADTDLCEPWPGWDHEVRCPVCDEGFRLRQTGPPGARRKPWMVELIQAKAGTMSVEDMAAMLRGLVGAGHAEG